jgi:hypothetical protein
MRAGTRSLIVTCVAMVGAAVIVGHPIVLPPADVEIPAVKLSASAQPDLHMLDPAFFDAVAAAGPQPAETVTGMPQLVADLSHKTPHVRTEVLEAAYAAGVAEVSKQALAGSSIPNFPGVVGKPADPLGDPTHIFERTLANLVGDANDVGSEVVAATFVAALAAAAKPTLGAEGLIPGGYALPALYGATSAATAALSAPALAVDGIRAVIENRLAQLAVAAPASPAPDLDAAPESSEAQNNTSAAPDLVAMGQTVNGTTEAANGRSGASGATTQITALEEAPLLGDGRTATTSTTFNGGTDLTDGNKSVPRTSAWGSDQITNALKTAGDRINTSFQTSFQQFNEALARLSQLLPLQTPPGSGGGRISAPGSATPGTGASSGATPGASGAPSRGSAPGTGASSRGAAPGTGASGGATPGSAPSRGSAPGAG